MPVVFDHVGIIDVPSSYQRNLAGQQARTDVQKFASTLDLMVQVNEEKRFLAASMAFCNAIATQFRCDRVSIGWLKAGYIRLRSISRTEKFDRQMAAAQATIAPSADELADIGVKRINLSLDTLNSDKFTAITRWGRLDQVKDGIAAAKAIMGG